MGYLVPKSDGVFEFTEKKSRFIGYLFVVSSEQEARDAIQSIKKKHYDARHNCYAYILKSGALKYSDDGEPQGTAGVPILEVIKRQSVTNCLIVVTRYFGGILLGAGGLLRAYSAAASGVLDEVGVRDVVYWSVLSFSLPYHFIERFKKELNLFDGVELNAEYTDSVNVSVRVLKDKADSFISHIFDVSNGKIQGEITDEIEI